MSELDELRLALRNAIQERESARIERDAALRVVEAARKCSQGGFRGVLRRVLREFDAAQAKEKQS